MKIRRKQGREVLTQAADLFQSDLWAHGDYGTLGDPLFDLAEQLPPTLVAGPEACETCGQPTQGLRRCDECLDNGEGR